MGLIAVLFNISGVIAISEETCTDASIHGTCRYECGELCCYIYYDGNII